MKKSLKVKRTAHYHQINSESKHLLIVIHGYAQLAEDFLEEFDFLNGASVRVIAPEALSKFYNKERKAVASWMTSHEREDEISDYVDYLEQLTEELIQDSEDYTLTVLGFSQGVSTALRWLSDSKFKAADCLLCSGSIPPELNERSFDSQADCKFHYFYGDNDPLLSTEKAKSYLGALKKLSEQVEGHEFAGSHLLSDSCKKLLKEKFT